MSYLNKLALIIFVCLQYGPLCCTFTSVICWIGRTSLKGALRFMDIHKKHTLMQYFIDFKNTYCCVNSFSTGNPHFCPSINLLYNSDIFDSCHVHCSVSLLNGYVIIFIVVMTCPKVKVFLTFMPV